MKQRMKIIKALAVLGLLLLISLPAADAHALQPAEKRLVYLVSDVRIPFWDIMQRGIVAQAARLGYDVAVYSAENSARRELEFTAQAIREQVDGIILSPTDSSAAVTVLKLAKMAGIPVVIADVGSDDGDYVSYIASDNREGSYEIGKVLVQALQAHQWQQGSVGIIAIPQKRTNGKARTAGFMKALEEAGIKRAGIRQQVTFSYQETYDFAKELIAEHADLRALWLQGSDRYQAALDAIAATGRQEQMLLICFDAEPEFLDLIPQGILVGAAMQQPFLMGEEAVNAMDHHLHGLSVSRQILLPILAISAENILKKQNIIRRNVLGMPVE